MATTESTYVTQYRVDRYLEWGFDETSAEILAHSVGADGGPLDKYLVKAILDAGCSHELAVRIFQ